MRMFKLWPFRQPFVIIGVFSVIAIGVFGVTFWKIQKRAVDIQNIDQRTIDQRQLSAARDLTGIWKGTYEMSHAHPGQAPYCAYAATLTLDLTQHDNALTGTWRVTGQKVTFAKKQGSGTLNCGGEGDGTLVNINNGQVNSSSYSFTLGGSSNISGSFTTDLMNGQWNNQIEAETVEKGSFKLTRQ